MKYARWIAIFAVVALLASGLAWAREVPQPVTQETDHPGKIKRFAATTIIENSEPGPVPLPRPKPVPVIVEPGGGGMVKSPSTSFGGGVIGSGGALASGGGASVDPVAASERQMRKVIRLLD